MPGQTAAIDAMAARLNDIRALLSALEIGTLQQAPDGDWYACYWDEDQQRTQCERSAPPTSLQAQVLAMSPGERATLQQELTAEAADLVRQIDEATRQFYYGASDPATTVVRVTSQQTPEGPVQVITRGPMAAPTPTVASTVVLPEVPPAASGGGGGFIIPDDPNEVVQAGGVPNGGLGVGALAAGAAVLFLLFGRRRKRD